MHDTSTKQLVDELDDLLDAERSALLDGNLEKITALVEQKEALIEQMSALPKSQAEPLEGLQKKVKRNQILLDGALQGIRRASVRLAAIRRIRKTLETYGRDGRKRTIEGEITRKVEKRA